MRTPEWWRPGPHSGFGAVPGPILAGFNRRTLGKPKIRVRDGMPTAAPPEVPQALLDELADCGRPVVPVGRWLDQRLIVLDKDARGRIHRHAVLSSKPGRRLAHFGPCSTRLILRRVTLDPRDSRDATFAAADVIAPVMLHRAAIPGAFSGLGCRVSSDRRRPPACQQCFLFANPRAAALLTWL